MDTEYYFDGHLRWSLLWESPNAAGAFIAALLPLAWMSTALLKFHFKERGSIPPAAGSVIVTLLLSYLLVKTYSRGALLTTGIELLVFFAGGLVVFRDNRAWVLLATGGQALAIGILAWTVGFLGRVAPAYIASDPAATNRLEYWFYGMGLIPVSPWTGLGFRESGWEYLQWMQPLDSDVMVNGLVNSYLELAVEFGLPVVCLWIGLSVAICGKGIGDILSRNSPMGIKEKTAILVATTIWLGWLAGNLTSSLWQHASLWLVPVVGLVFLGVRCRWAKLSISTWTTLGFATAFATGFVLFSGGMKAQEKSGISIRKDDNGYWRASKTISSDAPTTEIWIYPDREVLGKLPGKEARRLLHALPEGFELAYLPRDCERQQTSSQVSNRKIALVCGKQALEHRSFEGYTEVVFLHPDPRLLLRESYPLANYIVAHSDSELFEETFRASDLSTKVFSSTPQGKSLLAVWPEVVIDAIKNKEGSR